MTYTGGPVVDSPLDLQTGQTNLAEVGAGLGEEQANSLVQTMQELNL